MHITSSTFYSQVAKLVDLPSYLAVLIHSRKPINLSLFENARLTVNPNTMQVGLILNPENQMLILTLYLSLTLSADTSYSCIINAMAWDNTTV